VIKSSSLPAEVQVMSARPSQTIQGRHVLDCSSMEIIKSNRGGDKLCVDGYVYVKKKSQNNWIRWQCHNQRSATTVAKAGIRLSHHLWDITTLPSGLPWKLCARIML